MEMQKLKALAQDVTGWSNCNKVWLDTSEDTPAAVVGHIDEDGNTYPVATIDCDQYYQGQDSLKLAKFYAAANPTAVLNLILLIEVLKDKTTKEAFAMAVEREVINGRGSKEAPVGIFEAAETTNAKLTGDPQLHRGASSEQSERG